VSSRLTLSTSLSADLLYLFIFLVFGAGFLFFPPLLEPRAFPVALAVGWVLLMVHPVEAEGDRVCGMPWLAFMAFLSVSAFWSVSPGHTVRSSSLFFLGTALFLTSRKLSDRTRSWMEALWLVAGSLVALMAFAQWAWGFDATYQRLVSDPDLPFEPFRTAMDQRRAFAAFATPGSLAAFLILLLPLSAVWATRRDAGGRMTGLVSTVLMCVGLLVNQGVGAWVCLGVALMVALAVQGRSRATWGALFCLAMVVGSLVWWRGWEHWSHAALGNRWALWENAFRLVVTHPWFGTGLGTFDIAFRQAGFPLGTGARFPHNFLLQWWVETGCVGVALGVFALFQAARRIRWRSMGWVGPLAFTLFGLLDLPFQMPELLFPFAFLLGDVAWREEKGPSRAPIASTAVDWLVLGAIALSVLWPPFRALPWAVLAVVVFSSAALSRGTVGVPAWVFLGGSFFAARALLSPSASGASRFFAIVGLVVAFSLYLWSHPEPRRFLSRFLAVGALLCAWMWVQSFRAPQDPAHWTGFPNPKHFAAFALFLGLASITHLQARWRSVVWVLVTATLIRLRALAALLAMGLALVSRSKPRSLWKSIGAVVLIAVGLLVVRSMDGSATRWDRLKIWKAAGRCAVENPIWGSGPGVFSQKYHRIKEPREGFATRYLMDARYAHNEWLDLLVAFGLAGVVIVAGALWLGWRRRVFPPEVFVAAGTVSLVDFVFRTPLVSLALVSSRESTPSSRKGRLSWLNGFLALGLSIGLWTPAVFAEDARATALSAEGSGRRKEALEGYEKAAVWRPWDARLVRDLARYLEGLYLATGDPAWKGRAQAAWERVEALEGEDGDVVFERSRVMARRWTLERTQASFDAAVVGWSRAEEALPFSAQVREAEASFWMSAGELDRADACFEEALRLEPLWATVWVQKGLVLERQHRREEALRCYRQALSIHDRWKGHSVDVAEEMFVRLPGDLEGMLRGWVAR